MTPALTAASRRPPDRRRTVKGKPVRSHRRLQTTRPPPRPASKAPATCTTRPAVARARPAATVDASSGRPKSKSTSEQTTSGGRDDEATYLGDGDRGALDPRDTRPGKRLLWHQRPRRRPLKRRRHRPDPGRRPSLRG